ncbi:MAG TPA: FAD/NAD(P)-binding protein, partial [Polyangium sp.]|nr:FAD/NAD(P)-binding protein [Polyangium sp.]
MTSKHFDVVVLGRSLGALVTAALLARRDFTVLVLGQGGRPASYKLGERTLRRRAFTMLAASSPAWTRVLVELAQSQTWKRRVVSASPMMQVLAPRRTSGISRSISRPKSTRSGGMSSLRRGASTCIMGLADTTRRFHVCDCA